MNDICKFNIGVQCFVENCDKCGFNPQVEKKRKEKLEHDRCLVCDKFLLGCNLLRRSHGADGSKRQMMR